MHSIRARVRMVDRPTPVSCDAKRTLRLRVAANRASNAINLVNALIQLSSHFIRERPAIRS